MAKDSKLKKVVSDYPVSDDRKTLWGVIFDAEGEGSKACYVANVSDETAKSLIDAGRAKAAK